MNLEHIADKLWTILTIICASYLVCAVNGESPNKNGDKDATIDNIKSEGDSRLRRNVHGSNGRYHDNSIWSEWTIWSECSRTCGGGAAFRTRRCTNKNPSTYMADRPPICAGPTHEYTACKTQECPPGTKDYRATQCSVFNNKDPVVIWIPLASYGCELLCQTLDGLYMLNFGRALDGTECLTENNKKGMCISAACVRVGCDGVLNSKAEVDACGICGGWNHTCGHVKEMFRDALPDSGFYTYNSIATIPSGATNIRITDVSGLNYIALRDEYDNFILNGDWIIEWPGDYHRLGTAIHYVRHRNGTEIVSAPGPTDKNVQIMIIFREENPGVEYEYWSYPKTQAAAQRHQPPNYPTGELYENEIMGRHELPPLPYDPTTLPSTTTKPPTTTKSPPTTIEMRKPNRNKDKNKDKDEKKKQEKEKKKEKERECGKCKKVRNRVKNYCKSDFVLQVKILSKTKEGRNELKYDVEIISTYKNTMHLGSREYLWVPNRCNCPRLKPGRQYLVTGNQRFYAEIGESKLVVDRDNLVNSWKEKLHDKWDKIQANSLFLCASETRTE